MLQRSAHQDSNATLPYVLYSAQNLTYDNHELTLASRGNGGLLLDFIQTTVQLAPKGATVENQTLEETDGRIKYEGEWGSNQSGNFSGGGSTYTNGDGAYFELNFTGAWVFSLIACRSRLLHLLAPFFSLASFFSLAPRHTHPQPPPSTSSATRRMTTGCTRSRSALTPPARPHRC